MQGADYHDYVSGGILPLRHEDPGFELPARVVLYAGRIGGRDQGFGEGLDEVGRVQGEDSRNGDEDTHGDVLGAGLWQVNRSGGGGATATGNRTATGLGGGAAPSTVSATARSIPGWSFAWAAITSGKPRLTVKATGEDAFAKTNPGSTTRGSPANAPGGASGGAVGSTGGSGPKPEDEVFHVRDKPGWEDLAAKGWDRKLAEHFGEAVAGGSGPEPPAAPSTHPTTQSRSVPSTKSRGEASGPGKLGIVEALPIWHRTWDQDERFRPKKTVALPPGVDLLPKGVGGVVLTATHEHKPQQDVLLPAGFGPLVATHFNGRALLSSPVFDSKPEDELDLIRKARLHTLLRVYEIPKTCSEGLFGEKREHALAWQLGRPRGGLGGRGVVADLPDGGDGPAQVLAAASKGAGGPLDVGAAGDKHQHGTNADGEPLNSLHISTNAFFRMNAAYDAPLKFGGEWIDPDNVGNKWNEVYLRYDRASTHPWTCGDREGLWRWQVLVPYFIPGEERTPPFETFDTNTTPPDSGPPFETFVTYTDPGTVPFETFVTPDIPWQPLTTPDRPFIPVEKIPEWEYSWDESENGGGVITDYVEDPPVIHDGPTTTTTGQGGVWVPGGGGNRPGPYIDVTGNRKIKEETLKGYALVSPADRQIARLNPRALGGLTFTNELAFPGYVFKAQHFGLGAYDLRYTPMPGRKQVDDYSRNAPVIGRVEAIGSQNGERWDYQLAPGRARYTGGTAGGTINHLPPDVGVEQIIDGTEPSSVAETCYNYYRVCVSFGKPDENGGITDGFDISRSADGETLTFNGIDGNGDVDALIPLEIDRGTQEIRAFGVVLSGGGGGPATSIQTGTLAARPAAGSSAIGDVYVATDQCTSGGGLYVLFDC